MIMVICPILYLRAFSDKRMKRAWVSSWQTKIQPLSRSQTRSVLSYDAERARPPVGDHSHGSDLSDKRWKNRDCAGIAGWFLTTRRWEASLN